MFFKWITLVCVSVCTGHAALAGPSLKERLEKMAENWQLLQKARSGGTEENSPEIQKLFSILAESVQASADDFPELEVGHEPKTHRFNKIVLNQTGARFDAIRFKNNTTEDLDLAWIFARQKKSAHITWYILPVTGVMRGFSNSSFFQGTYDDTPWEDATPPYGAIVQGLDRGQIKAGQEYILWFNFTGQEAEEFYVALNLLPKGMNVFDGDALDEHLGLHRSPVRIPVPEKK